MNILLINHYCGTENMGMEYRPFYFAGIWQKMGHNVVVLTADFSHLRIKNFNATEDLEFKNVEGVNFIIVKTQPYTENNGKRAHNIFDFISKSIRNLSKIESYIKADVVICSSTYPLDYLIAAKLKKRNNAKIIYELHDIWPLSLIELYNYKPKHPLMMFIKHFSNKALTKSDLVVSLLPRGDKYLKDNNINVKRYIHIPNGIKILHHYKSNKTIYKDFFSSLKEDFTVMYAGGFSQANMVEHFFKAAKICPKVNFVAIGNGPKKVELKKRIAKEQIKNAYILDGVSKQEIFSVMEYADCLYIGTKKSEIYKYGLAMNKIFDYMFSGKPIILGTNTSANSVEAAKCGLVINSEDIYSIRTAVSRLKSLPKSELNAMGKRGKDYVIKNHDYNILAQKFLWEMEEL